MSNTERFLKETDAKGLAVLVNMNVGLNLKRSIRSRDEYLRHIELIKQCSREQLYFLEFLDRLPCKSYKVFGERTRKQYFPLLIFMRQSEQVVPQDLL